MAGSNDFGRIAKLNEMTKTLKQHGFAEDSLEAIRQANEMFPEYGGEEKEEEKAAEPAATAPKEASATKESYDQLSTYLKANEDFKKSTNEQLKDMQGTVGRLVEKMNEIVKTINEMESKIDALGKVQTRAAVQAREERQEERQVTSSPQKEPDRRPAPEPEPHHEGSVKKDGEYSNQRVGAYQPGDVSIEKMFYMGKK